MTVGDGIDARLKQILGSIRVVNGYQTEAGANVYLELEYTEHPDVFPSLVVFRGKLTSGLEGDTPPELGQENHFYPQSIEGFIVDDKSGTQGRRLLADLQKALRSDNSLGGLAEQIQTIEGSTAIQQGDDVYSLVQLSFVVFYVTAWGGI